MAVSRQQSSWGKYNQSRKGRTPEQRGLAEGYRSGLESQNGDLLKAQGVEGNFEALKIKYAMPVTLHTYTPDFPLPNGIIVETKGKFEPKDRLKHILVRMVHPHLDIRFVFQKPNAPITKGSKTTCAAWAEKHAFKWANRVIPRAWLAEPARPYVTEAWYPRGVIPIPEAYLDHLADTARQPHKAGRVKAG